MPPQSRATLIIEAQDRATAAMNNVAMGVSSLDSRLAQFNKVQARGAQETRRHREEQERQVRSTSMLGDTFGVLTGAVTGMVSAYAGVRGLKMAHELALAGAQAEMTERSFERMTASVGVSTSVLKRMKAAAGGTIPELKLMQAINTSLIGVNKEFGSAMANAYPELIEIARAANIASPALGDVDFMVNSLAIGLKRMSPKIIDNLGLQLRLGEANKIYADQLGKTTKELTAEEEQMALLNETLRAGSRLVEQVGLDSGNAATQHQALGAAFADTRVEIGKSLDFLFGYQGILTKIVIAIGDVHRAQNTVQDSSELFTDALKEGEAAGILSQQAVQKLESDLWALQHQYERGPLSLDEFNERLFEMAMAAGIDTEALRNLNPQVLELVEYFERAQGLDMGFTGGMDLGQIAAVPTPEQVRVRPDVLPAWERAREEADQWRIDFEKGLRKLATGELRSFGSSLSLYFGDIPLERIREVEMEMKQWLSDSAHLLNAMSELERDHAIRMKSDELTEKFDLEVAAAEESVRLAEQTAKSSAKLWEAEWGRLTSKISGIMTPTQPEDMFDDLIPREDEWDEAARQAGSVAAEGWASEWLDDMLALDEDFGDLLAEFGDPKVAAAVWRKQFYQFMHPEAIDVNRIVTQYNEMMEAEFRKSQVVDEIARMVSGGAQPVKREVIEALVVGKPELAEIAMSGEDVGRTLGASVSTQMGKEPYIADLAVVLMEQFDENKDEFDKLGEKMGEAINEGLLRVTTSSMFITNLAQKIAPEVYRMIGEWGWGRCPVQRGQSGGPGL